MNKTIAAIALLAASGAALIPAAAQAGGDTVAGKQKSVTCAACHGADGNSQIPSNPKLAGQHQDYLVRALEEYKSGARQNPIMAGMAAALSEQDMEDLAAYFASQSGLVTPLER